MNYQLQKGERFIESKFARIVQVLLANPLGIAEDDLLKSSGAGRKVLLDCLYMGYIFLDREAQLYKIVWRYDLWEKQTFPKG